MNAATFPEQVRQAFAPNPRGVVGVVDELLTACTERLQLDWSGGVCRVSVPGVVASETIEVTVPKSAFRAILARFAALCNERKPDSVSLYGGTGELAAGAVMFNVTFTNTPGEQRLEMCPVQQKSENVQSPATVSGSELSPVTSPDTA